MTNKLKLISIVYLALFALALFAIHNSQQTGYELSIYASTPWQVWAFAMFGIVGGTAIIVHQAVTKSKSNAWTIGFSMLLLSNFIVLCLPGLRGFFLSSYSDAIEHVGYTVDILLTGSVIGRDLYPAVHLLTASIAEVSDIPPEAVMRYLPAFFSMLFMVGTYLLATSVFKEKGQILLAALAGTTLLFGVTQHAVYPQGFALLLTPLVLYLYFRISEETHPGLVACFIILLLLMPFAHPTPSFMLILALPIMEIARVGYYRIFKTGSLAKGFSIINTIIFLASLGVWFLWLSRSVVFTQTILKIWQWIRGDISTITPKVIEPFGELQMFHGFDLIAVVFKMYGAQLIFLALGLIVALTIVIKARHRGEEIQKPFVCSILFITIGLAELLYFNIIRLQAVGRLVTLSFPLILTPLLVGFICYQLFSRLKFQKLRMLALAIFLLLCLTLGLSSLYRSPWTGQPSWEVSYAEAEGVKWFIEHEDLSSHIYLMGFHFPFFNLASFETFQARNYYGRCEYRFHNLPEHFGYEENPSLGAIFHSDKYLIITNRFKYTMADPALSQRMIVKPGVHYPGFEPADFDRLEEDQFVDRLYSNGYMEVWRIEGAFNVFWEGEEPD